METRDAKPMTSFTADERAYVRRELDRFFSTYPTVAEGFMLKVWKAGPRQGEPKVPPAGQTLVERGLMRVAASERPPRLYFTEAGLRELRRMMADTRLAPARSFDHIREELGLPLAAASRDAAD